MAYYRYFMPYGLPKFKRFAVSVWDVESKGKTDLKIAAEGLDRMEAYMNELGLIMNISDLGVTEEMLEDIAKGSFIRDGGYKALTHDEIMAILKQSM